MAAMKLQTLSPLFFAIALAAFGCSKKTDKAPPVADKTAPAAPTTDDKAAETPPAAAPTAAPAAAGDIASDADYIAKSKVAMTQLVDMFKADGTDCDKIAADLEKLQTDPQFVAIEAYEKAHPDAKKQLDAETKDQEKAFEAAAEPGIKACQDNEKVMNALSKLGGE